MTEHNPTKVTASHLKRDAFLYVRQSTMQQLVHNTESTQRQYALRQRAVALGWPLERVHVIDCDLGQSGASADRAGFQQLVSEVSLTHAGIVLGLEVSRLARNSADWHRLMELCALSDTLILDEDGVYDCTDFNDRLILGMKGTISEVELHYLRARLRGGILNKARRGELVSPLPIGFIYDDTWRVRLDPDEQVQAAIRLLFATFRRTGTAHATLKQFREQKLLFPRRLRSGLHKDELIWGSICHSRILHILHNPRYAGAFFFGRTKMRVGPSGKVQYQQKDRKDWVALMPGAHPGYIAWEEFEEVQTRLLQNAHSHGSDHRNSPPGEGPALLQGMLVCGVCGRRMTVRYHDRNGVVFPDYVCVRNNIDLCEPRCQHIQGNPIDVIIAQLVLATMTPVSLDMALAVHQDICSRQLEVRNLRSKQVERAQYEADLARQRYMRCDPNNRLVASNLEAEWNESLRNYEFAQTEFEQLCKKDAIPVSAEIRARVEALTTDFPSVWHDPMTTDRDRKRMIRLLIDDVTALKTGKEVTLQVRFRGGSTRTLQASTPKNSWQSWTTPPEIITHIDALLNDYTDQQVADVLNAHGSRSGKRRLFHARIVARLRKIYGLRDRYSRLRERGFLTIREMADRLGISTTSVKIWRRHGLLRSHAYTNKPECLYEVPINQPLPAKRMGCKLRDRLPVTQLIPIRSMEAHLEA